MKNTQKKLSKEHIPSASENWKRGKRLKEEQIFKFGVCVLCVWEKEREGGREMTLTKLDRTSRVSGGSCLQRTTTNLNSISTHNRMTSSLFLFSFFFFFSEPQCFPIFTMFSLYPNIYDIRSNVLKANNNNDIYKLGVLDIWQRCFRLLTLKSHGISKLRIFSWIVKGQIEKHAIYRFEVEWIKLRSASWVLCNIKIKWKFLWGSYQGSHGL